MCFFVKTELFSIMVIDNNFLFYFDICIKVTFSNNLNDEEIITSHLMCVMKQLSYDKNIMFQRKKTKTEKPWQNMLHTFRIL